VINCTLKYALQKSTKLSPLRKADHDDDNDDDHDDDDDDDDDDDNAI